jgi:hypothetical protein
MIIECHSVYNKIVQKYSKSESNGYVTKGKKYFVMELCYTEESVDYRIISDNASEFSHPILVRAEDFSIVSGRIPRNWVFNRYNECGVVLGPEKWSNPKYWNSEDFWDDWLDCNEEAIKCYNEELAIIKMTDQDLM